MMLKRRIGMLIAAAALLVSGLAFSQSGSAVDGRRVRQELEVMSGILKTTMRYATGETARRSELPGVMWEGRSINSYYLVGQGAVFEIALPSARLGFLGDLESLETYLGALEHQTEVNEAVLRSLERRLEAESRAMSAMAMIEELEGALVLPELPEPPDPPEAPAPPAPPSAGEPRAPRSERSRRVTDQELKDRLREIEQRLNEKKAESEKARTEWEEKRGRIVEEVLDAVARHGDGLTVVKDSEFINLVFSSSGRELVWDEEGRFGSNTEIISVPMSAIRQLKSGQLSRSAFEAKLSRYTL